MTNNYCDCGEYVGDTGICKECLEFEREESRDSCSKSKHKLNCKDCGDRLSNFQRKTEFFDKSSRFEEWMYGDCGKCNKEHRLWLCSLGNKECA